MKSFKSILVALVSAAALIAVSCNNEVTVSSGVKITPVSNARSAATAGSEGATVALGWTNPVSGYYGCNLSCFPPEGSLSDSVTLAAAETNFVVTGLKAEKDYLFMWKNLDKEGNISTVSATLAVQTPQVQAKELTQDELLNLLSDSSKESIYEQILASKSAAELLEKLSSTQKADVLNTLLTDEKKTEVFNEKLTDTEKARIFNELVAAKQANNTFIELLTAEEKTAVFNNELTTAKKAAIFDEFFADKRTNSKVVELLNDAEKETVFNALLTAKTSVEFVKEILNKEGNEDLRKSVKNYLVAELSQEELVALLNGTTKNSIYEQILASKNAAELLEKLNATQKADVLNTLLTDEKKTEVFNEKLTDTEKARIFNELVLAKQANNTFIELLTADEKTAVFNNELTTAKKAAIFDEIFEDKRTNSEVVALLNDAEKETVFNALLTVKTSVEFVKEILNKEGNEDLRKAVKDYLVAELTQEELVALLNGTTKNSIYEQILASKNAAELLEKLSTTQKADVLNTLLTDEKKTEVFNEKLTDTEKARIFNELVDSKRADNTFLTLLTPEEKDAVYNSELTTTKKAAIFDEIFEDKRINSKVVELLNDTEKETVFNALLTTKTSVDFVKEILNKEGNEDLRKSVKNYLVAELSQDELWALLQAKDTTAPANVTNLTATNLDGAVLLKWTDPSALDLFGIEITFTPYVNPSAARAISLAQNSIFVTPGVQAAEITNLTNGTNYTFTLKAVDTTGNKSSGASIAKTPSVIEKAVMTIGLVPDTTTITNKNVTVSVNPVTSATVKTIKYVSGERAVSYFTSSGTAITSAKAFTVTENGTYTVFVQDSDGRREVNTIAITNIDKTPPAAVTGLTSTYTNATNKITVSWTNPAQDFSHVLLSYTKGGKAVVTDEKLTSNSYTVNEVVPDGEEYVFTVKAYDAAGNASAGATTTIIPVAGCTVSSIELNRYHFAYNDSDQTINVTAHLENVDLLGENAVKIQLINNGSVTNYTANVDAENSVATATITAPSTGSSNAGTTYTVRVKIGDDIDEKHTARFNVSGTVSLYDLYQSWNSGSDFTTASLQKPVADVTESSKFYLRIRGYNMDLSTVNVQLYDSTGAAYYTEPVTVDTSVVAWTATTGNTGYDTIVAELSVPTVDDTYTVKVLFDGTIQSTTRTLQVYGVPSFASFNIPKAGTGAEDNKLTATVKGKNFKAPGITASSFTVECPSKTSIVNGTGITVIDDSTLSVTLTIPGTAGDYEVKITSGENSRTGTMSVKDYSGIAIGDFIYSDGTTSSKDGDLTEGKTVVAVVGEFNANGVLIGLGLKQSTSYLKWAPSGTIGYKTYFRDISAYTDNAGSGAALTATITGDIDGSDNWEYVKSIDPVGAADAATNYPAFNFAANYGATAGLAGELADGWYMPSIAELCELYKNKNVLNASLVKAEGTQFRNSWYWSSSQYNDFGNGIYAWPLNFSNGGLAYRMDKYDNYCVCCVRAF